MLKKKIIYSFVVVLVFLLTYNLKYFVAYVILGRDTFNALPLYTKLLYVQVPQLIICLLTAFLLCRSSQKSFGEMMGLNKNIKEAFLIALLCCSPMLVGYYFTSHESLQTNFATLFWSSVWPGFNEELVFRAFLFGLLVRLCGWNFFAALLLPGFVFASGHLYQSSSTNESLQIFMFTTIAAVGFSLYYIGWGWNIWFPVFMHTFMDFAWTFYNIDANVLGNTQSNVLRFISIGLGIYYTVKKMKEKNLSWKDISRA